MGVGFAIPILAVLIAASTETPTPAPSDFPEIGRVRALTTACGVMRDLAIPAFLAAREADVYFVKAMGQYVIDAGEHAEEGRFHKNPEVLHKMRVSRFGQETTNLMVRVKVIADALGDPRISVDSSDPQVQAQREGLQRLYAAESSRLGIMSAWLMRSQASEAMVGKTPAFRSSASQLEPSGQAGDDRPTMSSKERHVSLSERLSYGVRESESAVAQQFLAIHLRCVAKQATP